MLLLLLFLLFLLLFFLLFREFSLLLLLLFWLCFFFVLYRFLFKLFSPFLLRLFLGWLLLFRGVILLGGWDVADFRPLETISFQTEALFDFSNTVAFAVAAAVGVVCGCGVKFFANMA